MYYILLHNVWISYRQCFIPVSYAHLDVYKRQTSSFLLSLCFEFKVVLDVVALHITQVFHYFVFFLELFTETSVKLIKKYFVCICVHTNLLNKFSYWNSQKHTYTDLSRVVSACFWKKYGMIYVAERHCHGTSDNVYLY